MEPTLKGHTWCDLPDSNVDGLRQSIMKTIETIKVDHELADELLPVLQAIKTALVNVARTAGVSR